MLTFSSSIKSKKNNKHHNIKHETKYNSLWFLWCCF